MEDQESRVGTRRIKWVVLAVVLCGLTALASWGVYRIPAPIANRILENEVRQQATLWQRSIMMHTAPDDLRSMFGTGFVGEHDHEFLNIISATSGMFRLHLINADARIVWSTKPGSIGEAKTNPLYHSLVANGGVLFVLEEKPLIEIEGATLPNDRSAATTLHDVAEVYTPMMLEGEFIGAVEFYLDVTERRASLIFMMRMVLAAASAIALIALTITSFFIYRTNKTRYEALRLRASSERSLMDDQLRLAREVRLLGELNEWLQSCRSLDELFSMVAQFMTHILPHAEGSLYVYSNSRDVLDGSASWNDGSHKDHIHPEACWGLRRGRTYEFGASEVDFVCEHAEPHDGRPYFCFPILAHGETVGLMHLRARADQLKAFAEAKKLAQMCAEQISMAIANVRMRDQLHDQSVRDPLTGLFNRRHMTETLRKALSRCQSKGGGLSLVAIDVDHFKKFNDTHGHDAGDMVLRAVGSAMEHVCDGDEVACRIGGEEFMLVLPDCEPEVVLDRAEQLRRSIEAVAVRYGEKTLPRITISLGVAHYPRHGTMPQDLMRAADDALYEAKGLGRNQVRVALSGEPADASDLPVNRRNGSETGEDRAEDVKIAAE